MYEQLNGKTYLRGGTDFDPNFNQNDMA